MSRSGRVPTALRADDAARRARTGEAGPGAKRCVRHEQQDRRCGEPKSCPGALTEGTHHRGGKGWDRSTGQAADTEPHVLLTLLPARAGLEEAIGVDAFRTRVKRRKACVEGELAASSDALFLLFPHGVLATGCVQSLLFLP